MSIIILIGLYLCHFLGDYTPLSLKWMLEAKKIGKPLFPIFTHAMAHTILIALFILLLYYAHIVEQRPWWFLLCLAIEAITHFAIDVLKGRINVWYPFVANPANKMHWVVFGLDQTLHYIVLAIIYFILK